MLMALSVELDAHAVLVALREIVPNFSAANLKELPDKPLVWPQIILSVGPLEGNFLTWVSFSSFLGCAPESVFIELARQFSLRFNCRTYCELGDYAPEDSRNSPYWGIVWDNGKAFLGNDVDFDPNDGGVIETLHGLDVPDRDWQKLIADWLSANQPKINSMNIEQ
jgi:hypothetical protein